MTDVIADRFTERGCDVTRAAIEFTDPRHGKKFSALPMHRPVLKLVSMLPPQLRRRTGEIGIPPEARDGDYDLVVFGSPTWWLTTNMPVRSYLESPVESMLSWLLFMFFGGPRGHFLGIKLPAPNLKPGYEEQARSFADTLLDCVVGAPAAACGES